jgi:deoxyribodipyrimidine photo-lyase
MQPNQSRLRKNTMHDVFQSDMAIANAEALDMLGDPATRRSLVERVRSMTPHLSETDTALSPYIGGDDAMSSSLSNLMPVQYGRTRNHLDGAVTRLSPYIRHGVTSISDVRDCSLDQVARKNDAEKLIQQLAWRDYWSRVHATLGDKIWSDIEAYKTGFSADDYADELPEDVLAAETDSAAINHFLRDLYETGWIHNHARLYVAGYICHFRRVKWQAGAKLFLAHLIDGDVASNNLSWQWAASTFSHKPYFFNLENLQTFCGEGVDTSYANNKTLAGSYEDLHLRLFPLLPPRQPASNRALKTGKRRQNRPHH